MTFKEDTPSGALRIAGALDIDSANALRQTLLDRGTHGSTLEIDLSEVEACDAAALQVLLAARRDRAMHITKTSESITEIAAALGFSLNAAEEGRPHAL